MPVFNKILVIHPGAIGDVMLATPVAASLKRNLPGSRLLYWTHSSLSGILSLCPYIDEIVSYSKECSLVRLHHQMESFKADLIVDLSGSKKNRLLTMLTNIRTLHYRKQPGWSRPIQHAADNFLSTLDSLGFPSSQPIFPTISPDQESMLSAVSKLNLAPARLPLIGLVPGVGKLRSHRAWSLESWVSLARQIQESQIGVPVLIGGADEAELCLDIQLSLQSECPNAAGRLTLPETAALSRQCLAVVSGDTGPLHIAVAVGTPVVGLYGPTFPSRSGPYGCDHLWIDKSHQCRCHHLKRCSLEGKPGSGRCMQEITVDEVFDRLRLAVGAARP